MRQSIWIAGAALLLASCGKGSQAGNGTAADAGGNASGNSAAPAAAQDKTSAPSAMAASIQLRPGQWETTVEIVRMDMGNTPGAPKGMTLPKQAPTTVRTCLTPEQARRPGASFLTGARDSGCNYDNFSMTGGRVQGVVSCNRQGTVIRADLNGTFGPDTYQMESEAHVTGNGMAMNMTSRVSARRVGDCPR